MSETKLENAHTRSIMLLGEEGLERLRKARVALFGVGGVGSYTAEALVRSGLGALELFDGDHVSITNLNRQLCATRSTLGMAKVDAMRERLKEIDPAVEVLPHRQLITPANAAEIDFSRFDYIVDAIDTLDAKVALAQRAQAAQVPIIASMGAGNKLDPTRFEVADIFSTAVCPLARTMRRALRAGGIRALEVVYSREQPQPPVLCAGAGRGSTPGSLAFVPSVAGLIIAGVVVRRLSGCQA